MGAQFRDDQKCTDCGDTKKLTTKNFRPSANMRRGFRRQCRLCENERTAIRKVSGKTNADVVMVYCPMEVFAEGYQWKNHVFSQMLRDDNFPDGAIVRVDLTDNHFRLEEKQMVKVGVKSRYEAHTQSR